MYKNLKIYKEFFIYGKYLFILLLFWLSLNTGSKYINIEFLENEIYENKLNFIRAILPFFILFYLLIYEYFVKKNFTLHFDLIFKLFFLYGFLQISGLLYYQQNLYEYYWIICLYSLLFFYQYISRNKNHILINTIFLTNIFFILILFLIFIFYTFKENIFSDDLLYHSLAFNLSFLNEPFPRSSGLSRNALILFIFFNSLYFYNKQNKSLTVINIFLVSIILLLQSRGAIFSFVIIFVIINFLFKFENFKERLKYIIIFLLIPLSIFVSYPNIKSLIIKNIYKTNSVSPGGKKELNLSNIEINIRSDVIETFENEKDLKNKLIKFSNNRLNAWDYLLQIFFKNEINEEMKNKLKGFNKEKFLSKEKRNLFTGHGPQADRHFLFNEDKAKEMSTKVVGPFGAHASNSYIYSLICSGILGFMAFSIINILIFLKLINVFTIKKFINFNNEPFFVSAILIIIFLQLRALIENSYSVFGVDLIIILSAYLVLKAKYNKFEN